LKIEFHIGKIDNAMKKFHRTERQVIAQGKMKCQIDQVRKHVNWSKAMMKNKEVDWESK